MAKKASGPVDPLKAKEARQKKIAIVGGVVLLAVLGIQGPKLMKQMHQSSAPPPPPPATTPVDSPTTTPSSPTFTPTPGDASSGSAISATAPTAAIGQLSSFGTFVGKDPFASQVPAAGSASAPSSGKKGGGKTPPTPPTPPAPPTTTAPAANPTSAVISVNGTQETVAVGGDFPAKQPFFHLVSLTAHSAKISIAGGSLASGAATLTLKEGKPLTLQNTSDGTRYTVELFPQGTTVTTTGTTGGTSVVPPSEPTGTIDTTGTMTGATTTGSTTTTG